MGFELLSRDELWSKRGKLPACAISVKKKYVRFSNDIKRWMKLDEKGKIGMSNYLLVYLDRDRDLIRFEVANDLRGYKVHNNGLNINRRLKMKEQIYIGEFKNNGYEFKVEFQSEEQKDD